MPWHLQVCEHCATPCYTCDTVCGKEDCGREQSQVRMRATLPPAACGNLLMKDFTQPKDQPLQMYECTTCRNSRYQTSRQQKKAAATAEDDAAMSGSESGSDPQDRLDGAETSGSSSSGNDSDAAAAAPARTGRGARTETLVTHTPDLVRDILSLDGLRAQQVSVLDAAPVLHHRYNGFVNGHTTAVGLLNEPLIADDAAPAWLAENWADDECCDDSVSGSDDEAPVTATAATATAYVPTRCGLKTLQSTFAVLQLVIPGLAEAVERLSGATPLHSLAATDPPDRHMNGLAHLADHLPELWCKDRTQPSLQAMKKTSTEATTAVLVVLRMMDAFVSSHANSVPRVRSDLRRRASTDPAVVTALFAASAQARAHAPLPPVAAMSFAQQRAERAHLQATTLNRLHRCLLGTSSVLQRFLTLKEQSVLKYQPGLPVLPARYSTTFTNALTSTHTITSHSA